jgi:hypothetical protein
MAEQTPAQRVAVVVGLLAPTGLGLLAAQTLQQTQLMAEVVEAQTVE